MIDQRDIAGLAGATVNDPEGNKIGTVGQVYVDPRTGHPNWATVKTGLFGRSGSFVPLGESELVDGSVRVPFSKDVVKGAPRVDDDTELSDSEEEELYAYYRRTGDDRHDEDDAGRRDDDRQATRRSEVDTDASDRRATMPPAGTSEGERPGSSSDVDTTPGEESGNSASGGTSEGAGAGRSPGSARLRRVVVTEYETIHVPVQRETIRVEPDPADEVGDGDGRASDGR